MKDLLKLVINSGGPNPRKGKKSDQAHPPIHPLKVATGLSGNEARVSTYLTYFNLDFNYLILLIGI